MILVDRPRWVGRNDVRFAHLVSDTSFDELHRFVDALVLPRPLRFHRDHYDVPEPFWTNVVEHGAEVVTTKDIVRRRVRTTSAGSELPRRSG